MDLNETVHFLRYVSNIDARVMINEPALEMWHHALTPFTPAEAKQAIQDHYRSNDLTPATYGGIRRRALNNRATLEAQQAALEAGPSGTKIFNPRSMRSRNPELWDQLFEQGRREANEERAINGAQYGVKANTPEAQSGEITQFNMPEYTNWANEENAA